MFIDFLNKLKNSKIPVSINEFLTFLEALNLNLVQYDIDKFYYLARTSLIKDEKLFDKFDILFSEHFKSVEKIKINDVLNFLEIPNDWLQNLFEKKFSKEEMKKIKSFGDFDKLLEMLKKRLNEQKKKHQGGDKWIGTLGSSPFGSYGYNPEGIRIGQHKRIQGRAVKVWDKRLFKDFDESRKLNTRGFQVALKRLRQWARTGINEELDIEQTIKTSANSGYLDIQTKKNRENQIKILLFLDVGGSMDEHILKIEQLFSAAKNVFKNLQYFYFHNCPYEFLWKNNSRRWEERFSTYDIIRTYGKEYKTIFVGDASMSPYEILMPGGGNEHYNEETGKIWLKRIIKQWPNNLWINPTPIDYWDISESTIIIKNIFKQKMVPLSIQGIEEGTRILSKSNRNVWN